MVRAVKTKTVRSLAKGQSALLFPGSTMAEPWESWLFAGKEAEPEIVQVCQSPLENRLRKGSTLALPVAQVFCLPLWLNETDTKQFAGIIPLQIELRGLQPRGNDPVFDWSVVAQEGQRTLVLVGILPGTLAPELHAEVYESFDLSARFLPFPADALTIWREQDRLMIAITRGPNLAYFQALTEGTITTRVMQDLHCAQVTLEMQDVLKPLAKVMLWTEITAEERTLLQESLHLSIFKAAMPDPQMPAQPWKLTPATVGEARRARENELWIRRGIIIFAVLYLCAVGWVVTQYILASRRVAELKEWQTANAGPLAEVQKEQAIWRDLGPVVEENNYPLELLFHAQQSIPADQLHLTDYASNGINLKLKGEAKNVAGAYQFLSKLKGDPFFSGYSLQMGSPHPLPNDLAQFEITGKRNDAP